jgi:hypothetical protein
MEKQNLADNTTRPENVPRDGYIPFLGGRPDREAIICDDDIINLRINLNITDTVEEFLRII